MHLPDGIGDLQIRAYFASVIGQFRGPFGPPRTQKFLQVGESYQLVRNGTRDRVLSVMVTRNDNVGISLRATFSQQTPGSSNDFPVLLDPVGTVFRFILYPDEALSLTLLDPGAMTVRITQEPY